MEQLTDAIIICTRTESSRLYRKSLINICGIKVIEHLVIRLLASKMKIIIACPEDDLDHYKFLGKYKEVVFYTGEKDCPLRRTYQAAKANGVKNIVRVTHDKVFVSSGDIVRAMEIFKSNSLDYLNGKFIPGTGFEIFSFDSLEKAAAKYNGVEFIGYAIKSLTKNHQRIDIQDYPKDKTEDIRLLLDYPKDQEFLSMLISILGLYAEQEKVIDFIIDNPHVSKINCKPIVTVYTCVYNAEKYIDRCISSVIGQDCFSDVQYIIVDDSSNDNTTRIIANSIFKYKNIKYIRNSSNLGLASSSNIALKNSESDFIVRMDADDYFFKKNSLSKLLYSIKSRGLDAVYPNNYFGNLNKIQSGKDHHHIGGSVFRTSAVNHIKFTDGLRGYEGLDFFKRAKDVLNIGYLSEPIFFYRQHSESLTKNNLSQREEIKEKILHGVQV